MKASCAVLRLGMLNHSKEGSIRGTTRGVEQQLFPGNESFGFSSTNAIFSNVRPDADSMPQKSSTGNPHTEEFTAQGIRHPGSLYTSAAFIAPEVAPINAGDQQGMSFSGKTSSTVYAAPPEGRVSRRSEQSEPRHKEQVPGFNPGLRSEAGATQNQAPRQPTLLHLFEFWKVGQTRPRTIQTVENAVLEFHELIGPHAAESITRHHARTYRDHLIERHLSDGTIENRLGFLSTLFRFGQIEHIEHVPGNPFQRIPVNGGQSLRAEKDRGGYNVGELNKLFGSPLYTKGYPCYPSRSTDNARQH